MTNGMIRMECRGVRNVMNGRPLPGMSKCSVQMEMPKGRGACGVSESSRETPSPERMFSDQNQCLWRRKPPVVFMDWGGGLVRPENGKCSDHRKHK